MKFCRSINQSINELERMTQQNAALVEESSAAADSLKVQASSMLQAISRFDAGSAQQTQTLKMLSR